MITPKRQNLAKNKNYRKFSFLRSLFFLVTVSFAVVLIYVLFFSSFLEITSIEVNGNEYVTNNLILDKINPEISGKYFDIIKKNNLILIKVGKIKKDIKNEFKIIREIEIKREFPEKLIVSIIERKPQMVFCSADSCFILDENGEAYDKYSSNEENDKNNFITLREENSKEIRLGEIILEKKYMNYALEIRQTLLERLEIGIDNNFRITSLISGDIRVKTKDGPPRVDERSFPRVEAGWEIYFNENIDLEKEIEMLKVVLENKIEKNQRLDLEYIDLRIDNKIYYKFRDGTPSQIAKDAATANATTQVTAPDSSDEKKDKKKKD
ncbi:MAG: FtsQ-type POTRA domain-containing protein [Parcubacteria group bacterium]|jgi:cell division septal protein FtsQ